MKISEVQAALKKKHGDHYVTKATDPLDVERLPTDLYGFDFASGGGFPRGKTSIVFGKESTCKTNLVLKAIAMNQKLEPKQVNVFIDLENAFDRLWAERLGVNTENLVLFKPDYGEQAVDIIQSVLSSDDCGVVVIDSIASLVPVNEQDSTAEKAQVGGNALLISKMLKKCTLEQSKQARKCIFPTVIAVNQLRTKIGVLFGNPETQPGGHALRHASGLTVKMTGGNGVVDKNIHEKIPAYKEMKGVITKSKIPHLSKNFEFHFPVINKGGHRIGVVPDWPSIQSKLKDLGWLYKEGKEVHLLDSTFGTYKEAEAYLNEHEDVKFQLKQQIIEHYMAEAYEGAE